MKQVLMALNHEIRDFPVEITKKNERRGLCEPIQPGLNLTKV